MRLPPIHPTDLDTVQRELYDDIRAGIANGFNAFRSVLRDGTLIGPWNASLHHPAIGKASWELTKATRKNYRFKEAVSAIWYSSTPDGMCRL